MPWIALATAALGAASEKQKQDEQRQQAAINARYSPWTGAHPGGDQIQSNGALAGAMQGGAAGMAQAQSMKNSDMWQQWMDRHGGPDGQPKNQFPAGAYASPIQGSNAAATPGPWAFALPYSGGS